MKHSSLLFFIYCMCSLSCSTKIEESKESYFTNYSDLDFKVFLDRVVKSSQNSGAEFKDMLSIKKAKEDFQVLKHVLEEASTSLYRYTSKTKIDSLFKTFVKDGADSISYFEFTKNIALLFSEIGCMHSGWGHSPAYKTFRTTHIKFLPFEFIILNHELYILKNFSLEETIKPGTKVFEINQKPAKELIKELTRFMVSDSHNPAIKEKAVSDFFPMAYSNFIGKPDTFELKIITKGRAEKINIKALHKHEINSLKKTKYPHLKEADQKPLRLKIREKENLAIYEITSFNNDFIQHFNQNFIDFTDSVFKQMEKQDLENLVIDIRGNFGGWTANGKHLFSYFIEDSLPYIESVYAKKTEGFSFEKIMTSTSEYSDTMKIKNGYWTDYINLMAYPKPNNFKGKTVVLIDENSKSCSSIFSSLMKEHKKATFVGSQVGGAQCGSNGMTLSIKLPHSQVGITFSTALYKSAVKNPSKKGVLPDYSIKADLPAVLENRDTVFNFALKKIIESVVLNP